jgi:hypothetical protein
MPNPERSPHSRLKKIALPLSTCLKNRTTVAITVHMSGPRYHCGPARLCIGTPPVYGRQLPRDHHHLLARSVVFLDINVTGRRRRRVPRQVRMNALPGCAQCVPLMEQS